jgi:hypothetical protein
MENTIFNTPINLKFRKTPYKLIMAFRGEYAFLSNFAEGCTITLPAEHACKPLVCTSVEVAYMAWKTLDPDQRKYIGTLSPKEAKAFASPENNSIINRFDMTTDFKLDIMKQLLRQKFSSQNLSFRDALIHTGDAVLIEGNDWGDEFFGFCVVKARGLNHLGNLLMKVRSEILKEQDIRFGFR